MAAEDLTMAEQQKASTNEPVVIHGAGRKPYAAPALRVYGDVAALTRSVGNTTTNSDGGHGAMSKTH
jgi:hypothetical protein